MAKLQIVTYPDPLLLARTAPIEEVTDEIRDRVRQMFELMYSEQGVGLAAPQVGWSVRLFVMNPSGDPHEKDQERVYLNPSILKRKGRVIGPEGCLSFPGVFVDVERAHKITIESLQLDGAPLKEPLADFPARVFQHELDHLDNILLVDRMTQADKIRTRETIDELIKSSEPIS